MKKYGEYYLGLDIGTNSVGYAVTDERYKLLKYRGELMWGSHLFDDASTAAERRSFRTARRRLDRRQQRVKLVDEIFAPEVLKVDDHFYIRKKESALYPEDRTFAEEIQLYFNDPDYSDKEYHKEFPTIHHLIWALMKNRDHIFDIRLLNVAVDWLVAHRGHFLSEVKTDNVDKVMDFHQIYDSFIQCFDPEDEYRMEPWDRIDPVELGEILKTTGIQRKKAALKQFLYRNKIPDNDYFLNRKELVSFLAGGKVQCNKLFRDSEYEDDMKIAISDDMELLLPQLGDDAELIARMAAMYEWSLLSDILSGNTYISEAKVKVYEQHKRDLQQLKMFVRKYAPDKYNVIFRDTGEKLKNYAAYVYHFDSRVKADDMPKGKASREEFYVFLKKTLSLDKIHCESEADQSFLNDMKGRMEVGSFLPKQIHSDNRVIPYQLYFVELLRILDNAKEHYSFLEKCDEDGFSNIEKIKAIFRFRIPYYVGPLRKDNCKNAWLVRKAEGRIKPWNFLKKVDLDKSEAEFISRMTNSCTYIPGKDVLPKNSLLYSKFMVLNEINNMKCNGKAISTEAKKGIYNDLFCRMRKVTPKKIKEYLVVNGFINENDELSGIDITVKSSLSSRYDFRHLLEKRVLTEDDAEEIISRRTYAEDRERYAEWVRNHYPSLNEEDLKYVSRLKYKDFGRLSKYFLTELQGEEKETGEIGSVMHFLWETNDNLMQLLSDRYTFKEVIDALREEYYTEQRMSMKDRLEELGLSGSVKRPVIRTLDVIKDVVSTIGHAPDKIFVEMARGTDGTKNQRTRTRKEQLKDFYKSVDEDTRELERQLEEMGDSANNRLQSEALFLYYLQLGKCMYSGQPIDISQIKTEKYNIDHIYPQSRVKDDSILNNKVLVLSEINGQKQDNYPLPSDIRKSMYPFWKMLENKGLITKEKFNRLTRNTSFTEEELQNYINRQLVETRQSMKAVTQLLEYLYPESEIIYVKARLAADFRNEFSLIPKSRLINDLHHAKDAYLNIVAGNVYHEKFTKKWFHITDTYSLRTKSIFSRDLVRGDKVIWDSKEDLKLVKETYQKDHAHLTRYAYCQKGGLFDQMPMKKGKGQLPLKKGLDVNKYGGYNKLTASFFTMAKYMKGGKPEVSFVPVDLMSADRFRMDPEFAREYILEFLQGINTKTIEHVELPFGDRIIKIKTVLSLDGYRVYINGKQGGGTDIVLSSAESLHLNQDQIAYIKRIENYVSKKQNNNSYIHDEAYDYLSEKKNLVLYDELTEKLSNRHFRKMPGNQAATLKDGRDLFIALNFDEQVDTILSCISLLKSGRAGGCDLRNVGGKQKSGVTKMRAHISSSKYEEICIVDCSPAGLHENKSINLKELLK